MAVSGVWVKTTSIFSGEGWGILGNSSGSRSERKEGISGIISQPLSRHERSAPVLPINFVTKPPVDHDVCDVSSAHA